MGEELLPGIANDITLTMIVPKLSWQTVHVMYSVSKVWPHAIESRQAYDARVRANSTEELCVLRDFRCRKNKIVGRLFIRSKRTSGHPICISSPKFYSLVVQEYLDIARSSNWTVESMFWEGSRIGSRLAQVKFRMAVGEFSCSMWQDNGPGRSVRACYNPGCSSILGKTGFCLNVNRVGWKVDLWKVDVMSKTGKSTYLVADLVSQLSVRISSTWELNADARFMTLV